MAAISNSINYNCPHFENALCACIPKEPVVSLVQDSSSLTRPTVEPGSIVKEGQLLGIGRTLSAGIHSPVPGQVESITNESMPDGKKALSVKIKFQGEFTFLGKQKESIEWKAISSSQLCRIFSEKGVVNTFKKPSSLALEISNASSQRLSILVVRLFDNDPSYDTDGFIARNFLDEVVTGTAITVKALNAGGVVFLYPKSKGKLKDCPYGKNNIDGIKTEWISSDSSVYYSGDKEKIIETIKRNCVDESFEAICSKDVFIDSSTAFSVYNAVVHNIPVIERYIHVTGSVLSHQGMFKVRVGTPISSLIEECGGIIKPVEKIVINGMIRGISAVTLNTPITKYVKSIHFMSKSELPDQKQALCVRCGRCHSYCPIHLHPERIFAEYIRNKEISSEQRIACELCIDCSVCNTVCPSRIPLFQVIEMLKEKNYKENETGGFDNV